jgi:hypothetical protein
MPVEHSDYLAYLLRLWQAKIEGQTTWRASLESSLTGERQGFASLDDLFEYLRQQTGAASDGDDDEDTARP